MEKLFNRILISVVGIPILFYIVFYTEHLAIFAAELAIFIMMLEFYKMMEYNDINISKRSGLIVGVVLPLIYYYSSNDIHIISLSIAIATIFFIVRRVVKGTIKASLRDISYTIFGITYISFLFGHVIAVKAIDGEILFFNQLIDRSNVYLFYIFFLSFGSDSAAFFVGRSFGKHKLAPKISPNKTIEGFIGSLIFGFFASFIINYSVDISLLNSFIIGVGSSIFAQLGDLGSSLFKREFGVKNSSGLLMEHGGLLDRCDSVLFVAPYIFYIIKFVLFC